VSDDIASDRLELIPMSLEFLRASLEVDRGRAARLVDFELAPEWPDEPDIVRMRIGELEADPSLRPWLLRSMVERGSRRMVGHVGFHSRPGPEYLRELSPGGVELGYVVYPEFRRRGYAREASLAMMAWAAQKHGVRRFIVSIRPSNAASTALAEQLGFRRIGSHVDEVDGPEDIFELLRDESPGRLPRLTPRPAIE